MSQTLSTRDAKIGNWILNVTTRDAGDDSQLLEELTYRTIILWVNIVRRLEKNNFTYEGESVEKTYAAEINKRLSSDINAPNPEPFEFTEPWGADNARVTVWSTYRGVKNPNFHLNSSDTPQTAIDVWIANCNGIERAAEKLASILPVGTPQSPQTHEESAQATSTPETQEHPATPKNQPSANGVIVATRAPNSNRVDYANGQLVSFMVNKIEAGSNKGSAIFKLWTALGTQYPTVTVYMKKTDGNLKPDYEIIKPVIDSLKLSLEKTEAAGNWQLICKVAHVPKPDGTNKEFLNVVSLTAV